MVVQGFALSSDRFPTLSQTWKHTAEVLPPALSLLLYAVTAGVFLWLMTVHWLFAAFDIKGFDGVEFGVVIAGVLYGTMAFFANYRKGKKVEEVKKPD